MTKAIKTKRKKFDASYLPGWSDAKRQAALDHGMWDMGAMQDAGCEILYDIAFSTGCAGNRTVIEVGSWKGRSSIVMASGLIDALGDRNATVWACDGWNDAAAGRYLHELPPASFDTQYFQAFSSNVKEAGLDDVIRPHLGWSPGSASSYPGEQAGLLFIDALHTFDGVKDDWDAWRPMLKPGAMVIFDDVNNAFPGVKEFVYQWLPRNVPDWEWMGTGGPFQRLAWGRLHGWG